MTAQSTTRWVQKPMPDQQVVEGLKSAINASENLAIILSQRQLTDFDSVRHFFSPSLRDLHDPFLMKDMDKAVSRLNRALNEKENILVYGDYDVDGTTAVATFFSFLQNETDQLGYYIPDRYTEGYGISKQSIDFAADNDVKLIIALDCGIRSVELIDYATKLGIDYIICDHHLPGEAVPSAVAVLDPKQAGCNYPFKELSGCALGVKLIQACLKDWKRNPEELLRYLDLAAISIGCDIVSMTGENRVICALGLQIMQHNLRPGLELILENAGLWTEAKGLNRPLTVSDVVFYIGPRLNAAGRINHGSMAVEVLLTKSKEDGADIAEQIFSSNAERKSLDKSITEQALAAITDDPEFQSRKSTVIYGEHWHKGVVGIVASRLIEQYYRPTIVLTKHENVVTGSARSVKGFDVHKAIAACSETLIQFGGHESAAGLTMMAERIEDFKESFERAVNADITDDQLVREFEYDLEVDLKDLGQNFWKQVKRLAPFGPDNMRPVFFTRNLIDAGKSKAVGSDESHLKLNVKQKGGRVIFNGIAFGMGHLTEDIRAGKPFDALYSLSENHFNDSVTLELEIKDIRFNG